MAGLGLDLGGEKISKAILVFGLKFVQGISVFWTLGVRELISIKIRLILDMRKGSWSDGRRPGPRHQIGPDWIGHMADRIGPILVVSPRLLLLVWALCFGSRASSYFVFSLNGHDSPWEMCFPSLNLNPPFIWLPLFVISKTKPLYLISLLEFPAKARERELPLFFILPPSSSLLPSHPWEEKIK
jgi:hypothetical protein